MGAIPGGVDASQGPPMTIPLRHFVVGLGFLLVGVALGVAGVSDALAGLATLSHVHLLLAGWVCVTIMGAMTQFVPVWSGTTIHSRRLANLQLVLVVAGLTGFALALLAGRTAPLVGFGALLLAGFWTFAYNVGRTLWTVRPLDVTERHFATALAFFLALTTLGLLLAVDLATPVLSRLGLPGADGGLARSGVVGAHATLAVFGAILTTVYGALYQLATMFTQTDLHALDRRLQSVEEVGHPLGVVALAAGRLADVAVLARIGGLAVVVAALCVSAVLARKLVEMRVERTPMHTRYAVVAVALACWALAAAPAWVAAPTAPAHRFGAAGTVHLLALGAIGFVVLGTLYHVVPFVVWVHRYSDLLGLEPVPMIDDLYDDRLAAADGALLLAGTALLVGADLLGHAAAAAAGGTLVGLGALAFVANLLLVLRRHSPQPLSAVLLGSLAGRAADVEPGETAPGEGSP